MKCPICRKEVDPQSAQTPFCSERCRLIDLGNWAAGNYRIPAGVNQDAGESDEEGHEK